MTDERETLERAQDRLERIHTHMLDIEEALVQCGRDDLADEYTAITESISEFLVVLAGAIDSARGDTDGDDE